jgi:oligoendopeptidase F
LFAQAEQLTRDQVAVSDTWDLTTIYVDDDAWKTDLLNAQQLLQTAASHRDHLAESPARLRRALDDSMLLRETLERLFVYARLRLDEDTANTASIGRQDRVTAFSIEAGQALAFFDPEVLAIPEERVQELIQDEALATYRHLLDDLLRNRPHVRSTEVEEILAQSADLARAARDSFNALDNADLDYGIIEDENGESIQLTKGRYQLLLESKNRDVRRRAFEQHLDEYVAHRYTLASLHAASVRKDVFYARAHDHGSAREAALFGSNIPISVYDSLITATREAKPAIERYHDLRRRALGIEDLALYDMYVPLAPEPELSYSYAGAIEIVLRGVAALGDDYVSELASGLRGRWVDVYETKGKRSGAYSWGAYGSPPVILMNWNGSMDHVFTLAHEAGHAMHSFLADRAQPYHDAQYSIFLAEIASTLNEVLLTWQLLRELPEDDVKNRFSILNRLADTISGTLVRQTMFAEYELRTHEAAERGEPLTLDTLDDIYDDVYAAYIPGVARDDRTKLGWSRIPHFYNAFYVFQYATGISAAIALARSIRDEGRPAVDRFLRMLEAGGSDYSLNILREAGVDLGSPAPVRAALAEFDAIVSELTRLADRGALDS